MKTKLFFRMFYSGLTLLLFFPLGAQSQTFLSEIWTGEGGNNLSFGGAVAKTDAGRNVYLLTNTINSSNNHDFLLQKRDPDGVLLWQQVYNGVGNGEDVPADIFIDQNNDVYITGTSVQNSTNGQDLIVMKYSSSGILDWTYHYNNGGSPLPDDAGTSIVVENNDVFVTGASAGSNTLSDYVTIMLDAGSGVSQWVSRYDHINLQEVPNKIIVSGSDIVVAGASQITTSPIRYELATVTYDINSGSQIDVRRSSGNALAGVNEIYDITRDNSGNLYLTGATNNTSTGMDQSTYKLDPLLNIVWEQHFDAHGLEDIGKGIKVDAQGNVYSVGYVSTSNHGRNYSILKYNSSGVLQWNQEYDGLAHTNDEAVQLYIDANDNVFVTGHSVENSLSDFTTVGYRTNGDIFCQVHYDNQNGLHDKVSNMTVDLDGNLIIVGESELPNGSYEARSVKYSIRTKASAKITPSEGPAYRENELLIKFKESELIMSAIDKRTFDAGLLKDFVSQSVLNDMSDKLSIDASRLETFKVFHRMTSADSISISRTGENVKMDNLYATLTVILPQGTDINLAKTNIESINSVVYVEKNIILKLFAAPNDDEYTQNQSGLFSPVHGIEVEDAWDNQTGQNNVKIGVVDTGINWEHEDFGDGTSSGTKIVGGWDWSNNTSPFNQNDPDEQGHGTACAGIIGALRNNTLGVAGIAGGDVLAGNTGCQLFSFRATNSNGDDVDLGHCASAIAEGSANTPTWGYGVHILSNSYGSPIFNTPGTLLSAVRSCYKNGCVFAVASGNNGNTVAQYPATYYDNWVLKVGGNDSTGFRHPSSTYSGNIDIVAPYSAELYQSLDHNDNSGYTYSGSGTSFSTPMVAGVAGLLMSEHNMANGYPTNLAPEDVEYFISEFATDVFPAGYDLETGNGRANAELALNALSMPVNWVEHKGGYGGTHSSSFSFTGNFVFTNLSQFGLAAATYQAEKHIITNSYLDVFPQNTQILDVWPLLSQSRGFNGANPHNGEIGLVSFTTNINQNVLSVTSVSQAYYILNQVNGGIINEWVPQHPFDIRTKYSVYLRDNTNFGLDELSNKFNLNLYPNPSESVINFDFNVSGGETFALIVLDAMGKEVANYENSNLNKGENNIQINLGNLEDGVYFCNITIGEETTTKKVIIRD